MARRDRDQRRLRTRVELAPGSLLLHAPDGRVRAIDLAGCDHSLVDATSCQRFVRHLHLRCHAAEVDLITAPDLGAIAPRAAMLPAAPDDAAVIDAAAFDTVVDWLASGGRLGGRTVEELARLARLASSHLAVLIGELAARIAGELCRACEGPMRGAGLDVRRTLRPLELAARESERAGEALVAALAHCALAEV